MPVVAPAAPSPPPPQPCIIVLGAAWGDRMPPTPPTPRGRAPREPPGDSGVAGLRERQKGSGGSLEAGREGKGRANSPNLHNSLALVLSARAGPASFRRAER